MFKEIFIFMLILLDFCNLSKGIKLISDTKNLDDFNLAFQSFLTNWKYDHPNFNITTLELNKIFETKFNDKLKINRNEDKINSELKLNKILKNSENDSNKNSEIELSLNKYKKDKNLLNDLNSLETRDDFDFDEPDTKSNCFNCIDHQKIKTARIEQIKYEILNKLGLNKIPVVNEAAKHEMEIIRNFLKNERKLQNDQEDLIQKSKENIETKRIFTFVQQAPNYLKLADNVLYFNLSKDLYNTQIIESKLSFYIKSKKDQILDKITTANIKIYKVERQKNGEDSLILVTEEQQNLKENSLWIDIDIKYLVKSWLRNKENNLGLIIHCYDSLGMIFQQFHFNDLNLKTFISTTYRPLNYKNKIRKKRSENDCEAGQPVEHCCRWPLKVKFKELKYDFVVDPEYYDAHYCAGPCSFAQAAENRHAIFLYSLNKQQNICCGGREYSSIKVTYLTENGSFCSRELDSMVLDRCGCS